MKVMPLEKEEMMVAVVVIEVAAEPRWRLSMAQLRARNIMVRYSAVLTAVAATSRWKLVALDLCSSPISPKTNDGEGVSGLE